MVTVTDTLDTKQVSEEIKEAYKRTILENPFIKLKPYPKQSLPIFELLEPNTNNSPHSILVGDGGYGGKESSLDELVPLFNGGFKTVEELMPSDVVFNEKGEPINVVGKSPVHFDKDCYKVIFSDETSITVSCCHLWTVHYNKLRRINGKRVNVKSVKDITTEQIKEDYKSNYRRNKLGGYWIENTPANYTRKYVNIDSYALGLWLGDGNSESGLLTLGLEGLPVLEHIPYDYTEHKQQQKGSKRFLIKGLTTLLRKNNIINNKHIPTEYLYNDYETRLNLMKGIFDTDASVNKTGSVEWNTTNKEYGNQVCQLIRSLGIKVTCKEYKRKHKTRKIKSSTKDYFYNEILETGIRLRFTTHIPCFRLDYKKDKQNTKFNQVNNHRKIIDVVPCDKVPVQCISTDNPTGLYLTSEAYIPTHNTILGSVLACQYLEHSDYTALVTRRTYKELKGVKSIWQNLNDWLGDTCKINKSDMTITAPSGAQIVFMAFLYEEDKYKIRGESYINIINDESSELSPNVIKFMYRSLRKDTSNHLPLSMIHLSNPSLREGSDYLDETFVKGKYNHYSLDWRHNPFINQEMFRKTLEENMDYIDLQHQLYGAWGYKPSVGDLINREEIQRQTINLDRDKVNVLYDLCSIDLAGEGDDKTAIVHYLLLSNGKCFVSDLYQTVKSYPEEDILRFIQEKQEEGYVTDMILIEQEGGSKIYSDRHWIEELAILDIAIKPITPIGSKYNRARPLVRDLRKGLIQINKELENNQYHETRTHEETYYQLLTNELLKLEPVMDTSPNLIDCLSQARNYLVDTVLRQSGNGMQIATMNRS